MRNLLLVGLGGLLLSFSAGVQGQDFSAPPTATRVQDKIKIAFTVAKPIDVEVAVLDADSKVVRHLAAGVLGAKNPPPAPLVPGFAQELLWDGKTDAGKAANGGPFQ